MVNGKKGTKIEHDFPTEQSIFKFLGMELPFLYLGLFVILFVSLVLSSDLIADIGAVSKRDLIDIIEKQFHNDPALLARYSSARSRSQS